MKRSRWPAFAAAVLAVAAVLLASCTSLVVRDSLGPEAPRGWVMFACEFKVPVRFEHIGDQPERSFPVEDFLGRPLITACQPGLNEFKVLIQDREDRVTVPVIAGMVTYVGAYMQVISVDSDFYWAGGVRNITTTTTYSPRIMVGSHPLPLEAGSGAPDRYLDALSDLDWATRWHALRGLKAQKAELSTEWADRIRKMSCEDSSEHVRKEAVSLLSLLRKPIPRDPIIFYDYTRSADHWPIGASTKASMSLIPEGYRVEGRQADSVAWRLVKPDVAIADRDLDLILECSWNGGSEDGTFGLVMAGDYTTNKGYNDSTTWDDDTFLAFGTSRDGRMSCTEYLKGALAAEHPLGDNGSVPWPVSKFHLELRKRGTRYDLQVNGIAAAPFEDATGLVIRRLGLFVSGRPDVLFSRLLVYEP